MDGRFLCPSYISAHLQDVFGVVSIPNFRFDTAGPLGSNICGLLGLLARDGAALIQRYAPVISGIMPFPFGMEEQFPTRLPVNFVDDMYASIVAYEPKERKVALEFAARRQ